MNFKKGDTVCWKPLEKIPEKALELREKIGNGFFKVKDVSCKYCGLFNGYHLYKQEKVGNTTKHHYCAYFAKGTISGFECLAIIETSDKKNYYVNIQWIQLAS